MVTRKRHAVPSDLLDPRDDLLVRSIMLHEIQIHAVHPGHVAAQVDKHRYRLQHDFRQHDSRAQVRQHSAAPQVAHRLGQNTKIPHRCVANRRAVSGRVHVDYVAADAGVHGQRNAALVCRRKQAHFGVRGFLLDQSLAQSLPETQLAIAGRACAVVQKIRRLPAMPNVPESRPSTTFSEVTPNRAISES